MSKRPTLATSSGIPVSDNQNSITAGPQADIRAFVPRKPYAQADPRTVSALSGRCDNSLRTEKLAL